MPVITFSGGIDSTVLAFDIVQHPYRYGIEVTDDPVYLLSVGDKTKRQLLKPLVTELRKVSKFKLEHVVKPALLDPEPTVPLQQRVAMSTLQPSVQGYEPDMAAMPYSPGLTMLFGAYAMNLAAKNKRQPFNAEQVFFGFHYSGPQWNAHDVDELGENDTSPKTIKLLDELSAAAGETIWVRAPYLENRMDKTAIVQLGLEVGAPLTKTSSCMNGWMKKCGTCFQCMLRRAIFVANGIHER